MVPNSYGSAINRFRCPAPVESGRRCGGADLDYRVVRSHIRCPGNLSWLPAAQLTDIASTLVSRKFVLPFALASELNVGAKRVRSVKACTAVLDPGRSRGRTFHPIASRHSCRRVRFLRDQLRSQRFCLKKMRLGVLDWAITLRLWNMKHLMFCVGFATAKIIRFL